MTSRGEVVEPVSGPDLAEVAGRLAGAAVQAVAICFLHAWANPVHEQQAAAVLSARLPGVAVVTSHQVSGQWRGGEGGRTAVLSAGGEAVVAASLCAVWGLRRACGGRAPPGVV